MSKQADVQHTPMPPRIIPRDSADMVVSIDTRGAEFSLLELFANIWRLKWVVIGLFVLAIGSGLLAARLMTPLYRADATLVFKDINQTNKPGGNLGLLGTLIAGQSAGSADQAVARSSSRGLLLEAVEQHNLLPILFADRWDASSSQWILETPESRPPKPIDGVRVIWDSTEMTWSPLTELVRFTADSPDPESAVMLIYAVIDTVNKGLRQEALDDIQRQLELVETQLITATSLEARNALIDMLASLKRKEVTLLSSPDFPFKMVDPPVLPPRPFWPNPVLFIAIALMLWVIAVLLMALLARPASRA